MLSIQDLIPIVVSVIGFGCSGIVMLGVFGAAFLMMKKQKQMQTALTGQANNTYEKMATQLGLQFETVSKPTGKNVFGGGGFRIHGIYSGFPLEIRMITEQTADYTSSLTHNTRFQL